MKSGKITSFSFMGNSRLILLPMNSLNPQTSRPSEDLDAVIGRFQAWTMTQTQTKPSAPVKNAVSEISYEQALRATARYHRADSPIQPLPDTSTWTSTKSNAAPVEVLEEPKVQVAAPVKKTQHSKSTRKSSTTRKSAVSAGAAANLASQPVKKTRHAKESFAQVLRQETGLARVESTALRSSALTVRLSQDESALIKARADEAQLSTSAYLRQCALEVESLRAQVRETLAKMQAPVTQTITAPMPVLPAVASPARPGLFGGFRQWLVRKLGGQQVSAVC